MTVRRIVIALALIALALPAAAANGVTADFPSCIPAGGNAVVTAEPGAGEFETVRVYFRAAGTEPFYFLEMEGAPADGFWAVLPQPQAGTDAVDVYVRVTDAAGAERRSDMKTVTVAGDCTAVLGPVQAEQAASLLVGETTLEQNGLQVAGFRCDGIVSRLSADGTVRPDDACREVLMARAAGSTGSGTARRLLVPAAIIGGVAAGATIINQDDHPPVSQVNPD